MKRFTVLLLALGLSLGSIAQEYYLELVHDLDIYIFGRPFALAGQFWGFDYYETPICGYYFDGAEWKTSAIHRFVSTDISGFQRADGSAYLSFSSGENNFLWNNQTKNWDQFVSPVYLTRNIFVLGENLIYTCGITDHNDTNYKLFLWDGIENYTHLATYYQDIKKFVVQDIYMIYENNGLLLAFENLDSYSYNKKITLLRYDGSEELKHVVSLTIDKGSPDVLHSIDGKTFFFSTDYGHIYRWNEVEQELELLYEKELEGDCFWKLMPIDNDNLFVYGYFDGKYRVKHYEVSANTMTDINDMGLELFGLYHSSYDPVTNRYYVVTRLGKICEIKQGSGNSAEPTDLSADLNLYPNPATNKVTINLPENLTQSRGMVYNLLGARVMDFEIYSSTEEVDISSLNPGVYFLKIETPGYHGVKKLVKN